MKNGKKLPPIVCFSGSDWWYHNKGLFVVQVMIRLAQNTKVMHINSLGMRVPSLKHDRNAMGKIFRKIKSILRFLRKDKESGIYIFSAVSVPLNNKIMRTLNRFSIYMQVKIMMLFLGIQKPIFYINNVPAWEIAKKFNRSYLIYECTDIFEEMTGIDKTYIQSINKELIRISDLVIYVNTSLWESGMKLNKNSILLGHGVDYDLFVNSKKSNYIPEDILKIPKPIIGFYGDISAEVLDLDLMEYIAQELPEFSLALIGPISADVSKLRKYKNIYFLGQKDYKDIPHYGKVFDVAIMPWNNNKWIEFCNPIKTKEYLALGNPIVSTFYPEIKTYSELLYVARDYDEFISKIKEALSEKNQQIRQKRQECVKDETWDNKANQLINFIKETL